MSLKRILLLVSLVLGLLPTAGMGAEKAPTSDEVLSLASYQRHQGRTSAGRNLVVDLLNREPHNIAAHRWYIQSWRRNHESLRVGEQYRNWLKESPDDPLRKLTAALSFTFRESPSLNKEDCAQLESLLTPLPEDPERRAAALWRLRYAYQFESCVGDEDAILEQIWSLSRKSSMARRLLARGSAYLPLDARWLAALQRSYRDEAVSLRAASALWKDPRWEVAGEKGGQKAGQSSSEMLDESALAKARKHALRAAKRAARTGKLASLAAAHDVFLAAGHSEAATELAAQIKGLDERWTDPNALNGTRGRAEINRAIRAASRKYSLEQRLSGLNAMEDEIGDDDATRATWLQARSSALRDLNRTEDALADLEAAHALSPDNAALANEFAWQAAVIGQRLEEALAASQRAVSTVKADVWQPIEARLWPGGFDEWSKAQRRKEGAYIDTYAWLLYGLGRYQEAAVSQREALRLLPDAELHLHMGLIYSKLDRPHDAIGHLALGLRTERGRDDPIEEQGRAVFEELFSRAGLWHPGGPEAYLALVHEQQRRDRGGAEAGEPIDDAPGNPEKFEVGSPFPDLSYRVGERNLNLSSLGGLLLIDVWATWCGPCVKGMPHLNEVARAYKEHGLTTIALSVDAKQQEALDFFEGESDLAFLQGWVGRSAMKTIGIRGIPAAFILDEDLQILGYVAGYREGDQRIEEILNNHLELDD